MTRKLEELFDLPPSTPLSEQETPTDIPAIRQELAEIDSTIDKIDAALPAVRDLDTSDAELDEIAAKATATFEDLTDLGMNVDSRFAAELFAVAGTMLGHALTAKTTKLQKKLKVLDLQMKKLKLDRDAAKAAGPEAMETAEGRVMSRNDLLEMLKNNRDQKDNTA